jgi:hypothetical protein
MAIIVTNSAGKFSPFERFSPQPFSEREKRLEIRIGKEKEFWVGLLNWFVSVGESG